MLAAFSRHAPLLGRDDVLCRPGEEWGVCRSGDVGVVFGGEIEEQGEERVGVCGDVRLEAGRGGGVSWWFGIFFEGVGEEVVSI